MSGFEIIGLGTMLAGGVVQGMTAVSQAQHKAQVAGYNKLLTERNEKIALAQADSDAFDKQRQNARQLGAIRAAYGNSGLSMEGSPLDVLADTATEGAYDVEKIRYKGKLRATGYADRQAQFGMEEAYAETEGTQGVVSSIFKTGTSIMGSPSVQSFLTRTG